MREPTLTANGSLVEHSVSLNEDQSTWLYVEPLDGFLHDTVYVASTSCNSVRFTTRAEP